MDRLPDPRHGDLAGGELPHRLQVVERGDAREAVPGFRQAVGGPARGELGQFLLVGERLRFVGAGGKLGVNRDLVVRVDGECRAGVAINSAQATYATATLAVPGEQGLGRSF